MYFFDFSSHTKSMKALNTFLVFQGAPLKNRFLWILLTGPIELNSFWLLVLSALTNSGHN